MATYSEWLEAVLTGSDRLRREVQHLREADARPRRATRPFIEYESLSAMQQALEDARGRGRRYGWSEGRRNAAGCYSDPGYAANELKAFVARIERVSSIFCGRGTADLFLGYIRGSNGMPLVGGLASAPAPIPGAGASSVAANLVGDPRWSRDAGNNARLRYVGSSGAVYDDTFLFFDDPVPVIIDPRSLSGLDG
jgi:hypothetical protein